MAVSVKSHDDAAYMAESGELRGQESVRRHDVGTDYFKLSAPDVHMRAVCRNNDDAGMR